MMHQAAVFGAFGLDALAPAARALKQVVAEQTLELRLLKKIMIADGDDRA